MNQNITDVLERRLMCNVCLNIVGGDACQFLCPGQHPICLSCAIQYCVSLDDYKDMQCPLCKDGNGTVFISSAYAELGPLLQTDPDSEETKNLVELQCKYMNTYLEITTLLKRDYPTVFANAPSSKIISPIQMLLFARETNEGTVTTLPPSRDITRTIRTINANPVRVWICVTIATETEQFGFSFHETEFDALRTIFRSRNRFNISCICEVRGNTLNDCIVIHQERPVHLTMITPFVPYLEDTFDEITVDCMEQIKDSLSRELERFD